MENIPKVINYCWFGNKPLDKKSIKCIESWKKYCPDYQIKCWNESNFRVDICKYVKQAYDREKWAFVADYARIWILYNNGGLYFDTDVELIRPIDEILSNGSFFGVEKINNDGYKQKILLEIVAKAELKLNCKPTNINIKDEIRDLQYGINPGLGVGVAPRSKILEEMLMIYNNSSLVNAKGELIPINIVDITTIIFMMHGIHDFTKISTLKVNDEIINVYPKEYFCPLDYTNGNLDITSNTYSIHHYNESWLSGAKKCENAIVRFYNKKGIKNINVIRLSTLPFRTLNKISEIGIINTIRFAFNKIRK